MVLTLIILKERALCKFCFTCRARAHTGLPLQAMLSNFPVKVCKSLIFSWIQALAYNAADLNHGARLHVLDDTLPAAGDRLNSG